MALYSRLISILVFSFYAEVLGLKPQFSATQLQLLRNSLWEFGALDFEFHFPNKKPAADEVFAALVDSEKLLPLIEIRRRGDKISLNIFDEDNVTSHEVDDTPNFTLTFKMDLNNVTTLSISDTFISCLNPLSTAAHNLEAVASSSYLELAVRVPISGNSRISPAQCQLGARQRTQDLKRYCKYDTLFYESGATFQPGTCENCLCDNGSVTCKFESPVPCDDTTPEWLRGCCNIVAKKDFCAKNPCSPNANCTNLIDQADCACKQGFIGDGFKCDDIDECLFNDEAKAQLGGCLVGTACVNLPGSFKCECLPGHQRMDERLCLDVIRI